ncbi:MAG: YbaN family protein [Ignavibacteria bacterium]|nr:YbaN family protein [Ignavibacteria bacterium]
MRGRNIYSGPRPATRNFSIEIHPPSEYLAAYIFHFLTNDDYRGSTSFLAKHLFNLLGILCVCLAVIGIVLPVMPTTVFLLLAAYFFARGSRRFHDWLMRNRLFGSYVRNYREGKGMTANAKLFSISFLWAGILFSLYLTSLLWLQVLLILVAIGVTIHILAIKTHKEA